MSDRESQGVVGLPVVVILSALLASIALVLGMEALNRARSLTKDQKMNRSFDKLVEVVTEVSYGRVRGSEEVSLELFESGIVVESRLVQLEVENEIFRADLLPLPLVKDNGMNFTIRSGRFSIKLVCLADNSVEGMGNRLALSLTEK